MALLRMKDARKLSASERKDKLNDLKMERIKGSVTANKSNAKTKEIKRAISRLLTYEKELSTKSENKISKPVKDLLKKN